LLENAKATKIWLSLILKLDNYELKLSESQQFFKERALLFLFHGYKKENNYPMGKEWFFTLSLSEFERKIVFPWRTTTSVWG
jgi:hypothetical protein